MTGQWVQVALVELSGVFDVETMSLILIHTHTHTLHYGLKNPVAFSQTGNKVENEREEKNGPMPATWTNNHTSHTEQRQYIALVGVKYWCMVALTWPYARSTCSNNAYNVMNTQDQLALVMICIY